MTAIDGAQSSPLAGGRWTSVTVVNDGTALQVLDRGTGPVLVLIPGWSQTAAEFQKQIDHFSRTRRVIAIDHRGHGNSTDPGFGYRLSRLAADLHDVLVAKHLDRVDLLAHSMGCAVVWAYWDTFGGSRIRSAIFVDEPAAMTASPLHGVDDAASIGAPNTADGIAAFVTALAGPAGAAVTQQAVTGMFSPSVSATDLGWVLEQNLRTAREVAAHLLFDLAFSDWRDVIPHVDVPTLVIGGEISIYPPAAARWVANHLPDSRLRLFTADERGSHFMFWENPELFNQVAEEFLNEVSRPSSPTGAAPHA